MKLIIFFAFLFPLYSHAQVYCENNFRYEYVWDSKRMFCSARINLKYKLAIQLTPEGLEIINKNSGKSTPYNLSRAQANRANDIHLKLFSNGGVFLQTTNSNGGTKKTNPLKVNFSESNLTREKIRFMEHAFSDTSEPLTDKDQLIDVTTEEEQQQQQQYEKDQAKKPPYEITRTSASCPHDPKGKVQKRFFIQRANQKVKYAIDSDFYFRQSFHNITSASECESKNIKNSKVRPFHKTQVAPKQPANVTK
ncbi:MAG: hypothetical protein JNL11_19385 [Bdellovibrionaceae bacterium]|nr:hypothetical protein [Pseudobdellovibrionaceae bacterium]